MDKLLAVSVTVRPIVLESAQKSVKVRLFSEWFHCSCTSPAFGDEELLPWKEDETGAKNATFTANLAYDLSSQEKLHLFNEKPGVYAVLLEEGTPLGFSYVDCSFFALEPGTCYAKHTLISGLEVDVSVTSTTAFLHLADVVKLEPVVLDVKRWVSITGIQYYLARFNH